MADIKQLNIAMEDFDDDQIAEIESGINEGLDVSCYARKDFMAIQMRQIHLGLLGGFNVWVYARPEYDWFQMEEIRKGMERGVDYTRYAKPALDYKRMRQIRKGLEVGIDLTGFVRLDAGILGELREAILARVNIVEFIREGYVVEQLEQIRPALEKRLNIKPYLVKEFTGASIREIAKGLEHRIEPACYASIVYSWQQMREIRLGLENRINVDLYANELYTWQQMREIRLGLQERLDVTAYRSLMNPYTEMKRIRMKLMAEAPHKEVLGRQEFTENNRYMIAVSADEMEAIIQVKGQLGEPVDRKEVMKVIKEQGITEGILEEAVTSLVEEQKYNQSIVIAQGREPEDGKDGWYEYFFNTQLDRKPAILPDGSADYRNINSYELVENGQRLACYHSAEEGVPGVTVTGKEIPAKKGKEQSMLSGKGFTLSADKKNYTAALSGKAELRGGRLEVSNVYVLDDVNLTTGNVDFDGNVEIKGNVMAGTVIRATGDIVVNGTVEGAFLESGGSILLKQGANGAGNGLISASLNVSGKFFEAIKVTAGENIQANSCLNCESRAGGKIIISGSRGMIAGGTAHAVEGLEARHVGNKAGISTVLRMGIDETVMRESKNIEERMAELRDELEILKRSQIEFQRKYPSEVRNTMETYLKIENSIFTNEMKLGTLQKDSRKMKEDIKGMAGKAKIVAGYLNEGTIIYIDNVRWIPTPMREVTIKLSEDGEVITDNR